MRETFGRLAFGGLHVTPLWTPVDRGYLLEVDMCSGSEKGSYLRRNRFVYHSTLGLRVIKMKKVDISTPCNDEEAGMPRHFFFFITLQPRVE